RKGHQMSRARRSRLAAALDQQPVQHVLAILGLDDRILDRPGAAARGWYHWPSPRLIWRPSLPRADAYVRPGHDQISLVFAGPLIICTEYKSAASSGS